MSSTSVTVQFAGRTAAIRVYPGITEAEFTAQCRRAFRDFPAGCRVVALRDSHAKYDLDLLSRYPSEFADDAVYRVLVSSSGDEDEDMDSESDDAGAGAPSPYILYFENEDLGLTWPDVRLVHALVQRTHLLHTEFEDAVDIFRVACSGTPGVVPRAGFAAALRELIPSDSVRGAVGPTMERLFDLTDRVNSGACDFGELVAAFSLFCAGSKSDKLGLAFRLLDTNQDGRITRRQLWRFLRSFLTVLFSLSAASLNETAETLYTIIDDATVSIAQTVFAELARGQPESAKSLSFEEFGEWYNTGGFRMVPWLELLDLNKWPQAEDVAAQQQQDSEQAPQAPAVRGASAGADGGQLQPMLQFPLVPEEGLYLVLSPADVEAYNDLLTNTQLYLVEPYTIVNEFLQVEKAGTLAKADFQRVVQDLCPVKPLSSAVQAGLLAIFNAFEINSSGTVDMSSFLAGFLMLASGSKSEKLLLAFRLFDDDNDGNLTRRQLWTFLRSYLTVLVAVSTCYDDMSRTRVNFLIDTGAIDACATVFTADRANADLISFQEFGNWYNGGGFERVPWLELLDFAKWPSVAGNDSDYSSSAAGSTSDAASSGAEGEDEGEGDDGDLVFRFELDPKEPGTLLEVDVRDVQHLRRIVDTGNLDRVPPGTVIDMFEEAAGSDGTLTRQQFNSVIRALIPGDGLSDADKAFLSMALSRVFFAFDRNGDGTVDLDEFAAGFALLSGGSKSEKLQLAFRMFDADGDGYISTLEMWRYLRSFLTVLLALNNKASAQAEADPEALVDMLDSTAVSITQLVFKTADKNRDNRLSYAEFGHWYNNQQGYTMLPWLELLDTRKWPADVAAAAGDDDDAADSDASTDACFEFVLTPDGHVLRITPDDVRSVRRVVETSTIDRVDVQQLQRVFDSAAGDSSSLTKDAFNRAVRALVPGDRLTMDEQRFLSYMLSNLFFAFDADHNGRVDRDEFVAGFLLLCSGSKSDKLSVAFRVFDANADGYLDRDELMRYLRSFLTALAAMTALASDVQTPDVVESSAAALADHIFATADLNHDNRISYEEFGTWYNEGGYRVLPWLELLDLKKWPTLDAAEDAQGEAAPKSSIQRSSGAAEPDLEAGGGNEDDDDEYSDDFESDEEGSGDGSGSKVVFEFDLTADEKLTITTGDCLRLSEITIISKLGDIMPAVVHEAFLAESHDAAVTREGFNAAVRKLVPGNALNDEEKAFLTITLSNFFKAFDRDDQGSVECDEIAAGFTIFCAGNKSDKLSLAFLLFDDNEAGALNGAQLWRFLRAFLCALAAAAHCQAPLSPEIVSEVLDERAAQMVGTIFSQSEADRADSKLITYEELGAWYNKGGYAVLPWLELLDLSKWPDVEADSDAEDSDAGDDEEADASSDDGEEDDTQDAADPLYQFLLSQEGRVMLEITSANVDTLAKLLVLSRLHTVDVQTLYTVLAEGSDDDGRISQTQFNVCMRQLIPGDSLGKEDQNYLSIVLTSIFFVFAAPSDPHVNFGEFAAGFSLLVGGSKSDKLSQAFRLFNTKGNLRQRQLSAFLRSFLTALASVSTFVLRRTAAEVREELTATADELAGLIFQESEDSREDEDTITYEEFGEWYNDGGYEVLPWLELLDLKKWPQSEQGDDDDESSDDDAEEVDVIDGSGGDDDEDEDDDDDDDEDDDDDDDEEEDDDEVLFAFPLSPHASDNADDSELLLITASDCRSLNTLVTRSALPSVPCDKVFAAFTAGADDNGLVSKREFDEAVRSLVPADRLTDDDKAFLSFTLSRMFFAFDSAATDAPEGQVPATELATGMTMLGGGNKSNKLLLAFSTFAAGSKADNTSVDRDGLASMLRCFLTMLLAVNSFNSTVTDVTPSGLRQAAERCAADIFKRVAPEDGLISYEGFGLWYNNGGFDVLPWLELLDVRKWPTGVDAESSAGDEDDDEDDGEAEAELSEGSGEESEMTDDEGLEDAPADDDGAGAGASSGSPGHARFAPTAEVVHVDTSSPAASPKPAKSPKSPGSPEWRGSRRMSFSKSIPAMMQARRTMSNVDTEALQAAFLIEANEDGVLDKAAFSRVVDALFPGEAMEEQDKVFLKFTLDNVFTTFDRDRDGFVDYDEFCTGMSMLAGDSREQKMRLAFSLMDEDGDGSITPHELWKTLRSFMTTLAAMDPDAARRSKDMKEQRRMHTMIDRTAKEAMERVFREADVNDDELITFQEWAAWYNTKGSESLPWIHALEVAAATSPAARRRSRTGSMGRGEPVDTDGIEMTKLGGAGADDDDDGSDDEEKAGGAFGEDFTLALPVAGYGASAGDATDLTVSGADLNHASTLRAGTGIGSLHLQQVYDALLEASNGQHIGRAEFVSAITPLLASASAASADSVRNALNGLFKSFDLHASGVAVVGDLVTGLSPLVTGGLEERLQVIVAAYDLDEDGKISRRETFSMLHSLTTALVALRQLRAGEEFTDELRQLVFKFAAEALRSVMGQADTNKDGLLSLDEVRTWMASVTSGDDDDFGWLRVLMTL